MESLGKIHQSDGCSELQPSSFIDPIQGLQAQLQIWSSTPGAITLSSLSPLSDSSPIFQIAHFLAAHVTHRPPSGFSPAQVRDHLPRPQPHLQGAAADGVQQLQLQNTGHQ